MKSGGTRRTILFSGLAALALGPARAAGFAFQDPRDTAARAVPLPSGSPLLAVTRAGSRLVAVGLRGVIAISEDSGRQWVQAASPVSVDLTDVFFVDERFGWATGHDGVVLNSRDGGKSWIKQLDGAAALKSMLAYYVERKGSDDRAAGAIKLIQRNAEFGGDLPWLSTLFRSRTEGIVVGPFGMIAATADGGQTWVPWLDRIDNPDARNLNAITTVGDPVYIASERGVLFRMDRAASRFVTLQTPYTGTYFGVVGKIGGPVLAYGLRGTCYISKDGVGEWRRIDSGMTSAISAGAILHDGRCVLVSQNAQAAISDPEMSAFRPLDVSTRMPLAGVTIASDGAVALVGLTGAVIRKVAPV